MKNLIIILITLFTTQLAIAQPGTIKMDTTIIEKDGEKVIIIKPVEGQDITPEENEVKVQVESKNEETGKVDTTVINVGGVQVIIKEKDKEQHEKSADKESKRVEDEEDEEDEDSKKPKTKRFTTRWFMLDVGLATLLEDGSFNLTTPELELNQGRSWDINLHIFRQRIGFARNHVNLMYGMSVDFNHFNFDSNSVLVADTNVVTFRTPDNVNYNKNKLRTTYLEVPVLLNFNTNPRKSSRSVRVSGGVYGGLLVRAKTKQKSDSFGKTTDKDNYNLNRFRYGIVGELGLGPVNLYAKYQLNSMFENDQAGPVYPLTFGITVIPF